jgi:hypothetical protein
MLEAIAFHGVGQQEHTNGDHHGDAGRAEQLGDSQFDVGQVCRRERHVPVNWPMHEAPDSHSVWCMSGPTPLGRLLAAACLTVLVASGCGSDDENEPDDFPASQAPDENEPDENETDEDETGEVAPDDGENEPDENEKEPNENEDEKEPNENEPNESW